LHGDSTKQGEETNVEANKVGGGGGRPARLKIPLGILIFLVCLKIIMNDC